MSLTNLSKIPNHGSMPEYYVYDMHLEIRLYKSVTGAIAGVFLHELLFGEPRFLGQIY